MLNGVNHTCSQVSSMTMSRQSSLIYSPGTTRQEGNHSQILTMCVHLQCPSVNEDNPPPGQQLKKIVEFKKYSSHRMGLVFTGQLGAYIYAFMLLCELIIHDQQEKMRRMAHYISKQDFTKTQRSGMSYDLSANRYNRT